MQPIEFPPDNLDALKNIITAVAQRAILPVRCTDVATGKPVWALGAVVHDPSNDGGVRLVLLAKMFDGDPCKELMPPTFESPITEAA